MKKYYIIATIISILLVVGFIFMPESEPQKKDVAMVSATTTAERINYFALHGWETEELFSKEVVIPTEFSESYENFVQIQDKQKMPLRDYKGKQATIYTYSVKNYSPDGKKLLAEMIVCDGKAISSVIYAEDDTNYMLSVH